jgi:hypothetical protein
MSVVRYAELIGPTSAVTTYATQEIIESCVVDVTSSSTDANVILPLVVS